MLVATYEMPSFTTKKDAEDMAKPHGLKLVSFERLNGNLIAKFEAAHAHQVGAFSADLSYHAIDIEAR